MKKETFILLILWGIASRTGAQLPEIIPCPPHELGKEFAACQDILHRLYTSAGLTDDYPVLCVMDLGAKIPAQYENGRIILNSRLVQRCREWYGENRYPTALAVVIGHELQHYQSSSKGKKIFGFASSGWSEQTEDEEDADLGGLYFAYLAGYEGIAAIYPDLLDRIYEAFGLKDPLPGYERIDYRKKADQRLMARADTLSRFFHLGNAMMGLREFDMAEEAFQHILNRGYKAREVRLNHILAGLYGNYLFPNGYRVKSEFFFPVELEPAITIDKVIDAGKTRSTEERDYLESLMARLDALHRDYPRYPKVRFYLALCHALTGNPEQAREWSVGLPDQYTERLALIGSLAALKKDPADVLARFELERLSREATDGRLARLARFNQEVLRVGYPAAGPPAVNCPYSLSAETYTRKRGRNAAGLEWEEKADGVVYGFWWKKSLHKVLRYSTISEFYTPGETLISISSNLWAMPGCDRIIFYGVQKITHKWEILP